MQYRQLGRSGLEVSLVGVGCNRFGLDVDAAGAQRIVETAIDHGVTLFDTAESYGDGQSERMLGQALGTRREAAVITTKFAAPVEAVDGAAMRPNASRRYIRYAVERSLQRLGTDWIDLYQVHWPDPDTPIEETLDALGDLVREGKVRYVGLSNFPAWMLTDAVWVARTRGLPHIVSLESRWNLLEREAEAEIVPACQALGVGILPYFPLAAGLLAGGRRDRSGSYFSRLAGTPFVRGLGGAQAARHVDRLQAFAEARGRTLLELAVSWLAAQPCVGSVIAGAGRTEQVAANAVSAGWVLSAEDLALLDALAAEPSADPDQTSGSDA